MRAAVRLRRFSILGVSAIGVVLAAGLAARPSPAPHRRILEARAATLAAPFDQVARLLPAWRFEPETGGSRLLLRQLTDLHVRMDLLAVADASLFQTASPSAVGWWIDFAGNEVVLAYTPRSRGARQIDANNWMRVLLRPDVHFGYSNPNLDPEGYNTLIAWQLAERYYQEPGLAKRLGAHAAIHAPQSVALLALLEAGELDYAWEYLSVARQHHLDYVRLPAAVNLGDPRLAATYARATVAVAGARPGETVTLRGRPIAYAITIPPTAENISGAAAFLRLLLAPRGREILAANFQPARARPCVGGDRARAPEEVRQWIQTWPQCP